MTGQGRYDYIVVGGGSSGCIVAGRLADTEPSARILMLEAGPSAEEHPETLSASGYKDAFVNDEVFWERFTSPQPHAGGHRIFAGTGSVLGGSGSVNGMVYTRGAREDYDEWPAGWRWDEITTDFANLEERLRPRRRPPTQWTEACISAAVTCGFERREDLNDGNLGNVVGYEWMTYEGAERRSSYRAFIRERTPTGTDNLTVLTRATARKVLFDESRRAVGVEFEQGGVLRKAEATREVVLCAGALETPRLLLLSGVGADQALRAAGIAPVARVDGVGQNLHDHPNVPLFFMSRGLVDCLQPQLYSFYRTREEAALPAGQSDTCYVFWPAPSAMKQAMQRILPGQLLPQKWVKGPARGWIRAGVAAAFATPGVAAAVDHLYGIVVILGKPTSRGSVRLKSGDPTAPGIVDPNYFADEGDMKTMVEGVKLARRLSRSGGLGAWGSKELMPGPLVSDDAKIAKWVGKNAITTYHFAGTCRMGEDAASVCDSRLRLRGVTGLRVADASAVPTTPVSALNAPSMLIGWRAADYLRGERQ